jgi:hypothetical protein
MFQVHDRDSHFLSNVVNCVLSNPFYRMKVLESKLIKDRIATITDRQILIDQFTRIFRKTFRYSSITMYDEPVTKCSIQISDEDVIEKKWILELKDLLMLADDQIHIHFDYDVSNKIDYQEEDLYDISLQKYLQFFPCCIILNIIENVDDKTSAYNSSDTVKQVIVLPSLQAKDHSMNKLKEYIKILYGDHFQYSTLNERISYEIGDIEEQCGSIELDLHFNNNKSFKNEIPIKRVYQTTISGTSNHSMNVDISYREDLCSTLSGIVQCDDDLYAITSGHGMSDKCAPLNESYTLESKIWPSALDPKDVNEKNYNYLSKYSDSGIYNFVSDVAILKPTESEKRKLKGNYLFSDAEIIAQYNEVEGIEIPVLPGINELKRRVHYSGCKSTGSMDVVGSGFFAHQVDKLWICERFYVAKHVESKFAKDYNGEDEDDNNDGTTGTLSCDSGACVVTDDAEIHSFVIGKTTGDEKFRLLSPAHFILKQINKLTRKKNVKFMNYVRKNKFPTSNCNLT